MLSCIQYIIAYDKHNAQLFYIEINGKWIFIGCLNTNFTANHYPEIKSLHRLFLYILRWTPVPFNQTAGGAIGDLLVV